MKTKPSSPDGSTLVLSLLALMLAFPVSGRATLLLYDGFSYTSGVAVPDTTSASVLNGGTGAGGTSWSSGWFDNSADASAYTVTSGGLSYGSLTTAGNALNRGNDNLGAARNFTAQNSGTYYFSALLNLADSASTYAGVSIGGAYFGSLNSGGVRQLGIAGGYGSGITALTSTQLGATATTYFVVGKLEFSSTGADTVSLWVNPVVSVEAGAGAASAVNTSISMTALARIDIYQSAAGFNLTADELRFGTTWADVTAGLPASAIPEPSTYALLLALAGLGGAILHRRFRR